MIEIVYYYFRRSLVYLVYFLPTKARIQIDRPIFIVGHQGNGSTLVSRVLRRSPHIVSITGNSKYWSGADEMQSVASYLLTKDLSMISSRAPKDPRFGHKRGWIYGCNDMLSHYLRDQSSESYKSERVLLRLISRVLNFYGLNNGSRFLDKSQSYTLKLKFLDKIFLKVTSPIYLGIVRNPYVVCYRAAMLKTSLSRSKISPKDKVRIAAEHWNNSVNQLVNYDGSSKILVLTMEELLQDWEKKMKEVFEHCEVAFNPIYLPKKVDVVPFGSRRKSRWFPIRRDINSVYLSDIPDWAKSIVKEVCEENIKFFQY